MKKKFFSAMLLVAAFGMTSCSDEIVVDAGSSPEDSGKYAYISTAVSLPSSAFTRSATDDASGSENDQTNSDGDKSGNTPDYEYGHDYESDVRSMLLVIANTNDEYITHSVVPSITETANQNSKYGFTVKSKIPYDVLEEAYEGNVFSTADKNDTEGIKIHLYAYCNYTADILDKFNNITDDDKKGGWINWYGNVKEAPASVGPKPAITNTIWAKRSFLMTNATSYETMFPATLDAWDAHTNESEAYDLTKNAGTADVEALPVERTAARIDFKDASKDGDQVYKLKTVLGKTDDDIKNLFSVKLTRMALVNMSQNFYYLRRVSDNGLSKDSAKVKESWKVGGKETPNNYVVDVDASLKNEVKGINETNVSQYFNFHLFKTDKSYNRNGWYADKIVDILSGTHDDDNWNTTAGTDSQGGYKIWRYVTENTIPAYLDEEKGEWVDSQQKNIQSTGIIFKGAIIAGDDIDGHVTDNVKKALNVAAGNGEDGTQEGKDKNTKESYDYPVLYSYNNVLYAGIEELVAAAFENGENGPLYNAINRVLTENWKLSGTTYSYDKGHGDGTLTVLRCDSIFKKETFVDEETKNEVTYEVDFIENSSAESDPVKNFMKTVAQPEINVTVYLSTNEEDGEGMGYYCYYFYWNRHNDNLKSGKMGPMEFATVRNNVYKLAVTAINQLGHPIDTDHDPDPVDPEDPDEDPTNYIKVDVEVLPWVVRVNDITF